MFLYRFIERELASELRGKLLDMAHIGAAELDVASYTHLRDRLGELDDAGVAAVETSPEYRQLYAELNLIRGTEAQLMQYAYLLAPTADPKNPKFVVDA